MPSKVSYRVSSGTVVGGCGEDLSGLMRPETATAVVVLRRRQVRTSTGEVGSIRDPVSTAGVHFSVYPAGRDTVIMATFEVVARMRCKISK